jgi:quinol monooxygenase YgiN
LVVFHLFLDSLYTSYLSVFKALFIKIPLTSICGKQLALSPRMVFMTIRMKVLPEKRKELMQALESLANSIKVQKGCKRCEICVSADDPNEFYLVGEWENQKELDIHLRSELFKVLMGAMSLLKKPHEMRLYTGLSAGQLNDMTAELNCLRGNV